MLARLLGPEEVTSSVQTKFTPSCLFKSLVLSPLNISSIDSQSLNHLNFIFHLAAALIPNLWKIEGAMFSSFKPNLSSFLSHFQYLTQESLHNLKEKSNYVVYKGYSKFCDLGPLVNRGIIVLWAHSLLLPGLISVAGSMLNPLSPLFKNVTRRSQVLINCSMS